MSTKTICDLMSFCANLYDYDLNLLDEYVNTFIESHPDLPTEAGDHLRTLVNNYLGRS